MLVVFDTTVLINALVRPDGVAFRLLRLVQGLPIAQGLVTDITGWEFVRVARELGYHTESIEHYLDAFGELFEPGNVAASPVSRRLLANALDNVSLEDAALHLTGRRLVDFRSAVPTALVSDSDARDGNDLHVVWAVVDRDAEVLCTTDKGFPPSIGSAQVLTPRALLEALVEEDPDLRG